MNGNFLIKMANMLHRICPTIIEREGRLIKSPRKACTLNPPCERRFSNLVQRFIDGLVSKVLVRWTLVLTPMATVFLVAWESFAGWSSRLLPIRGIFCILRRRLRPKWWCLRRARRNFFFNSSISRYMSLSFFAWETWLFPRDWLLLVCMVCPLPSWSPLCWGFTTELLCCEPSDSAWCGLSLPWCGPIVGWCEPDSSIFNTKPKSPSDKIKLSHRWRQL